MKKQMERLALAFAIGISALALLDGLVDLLFWLALGLVTYYFYLKELKTKD